MAYISSFTYCDGIQTEITQRGPIQQIVNPLQVLTPVAIPSNYTFAISCNVAGFDNDEVTNIRLMFVSPDEQILNDTGYIPLPINHPESQRPSVMQFNLEMRNIIFREKGLYSTRIYENDLLIGEYKIEVIIGGE